jgi:four helix bundle protein
MATIQRVEDLQVWQLAREFACDVREMLKDEQFRYEFGLKEQIKGSSGSIMDNIAEGFGRGSKHEFVNHLTIAKGSAEESRSQLYRCLDAGLVKLPTFVFLSEKLESTVQKISALIRYLNQADIKGQKFKGRV